MKLKVYKTVLVGLLLCLLFLPLIQSTLNIRTVPPLKGAFTQKENTEFSIQKWNSGEYQAKKRDYLNENFGFRNDFVRLNNQVRFNLFSKLASPDIYMGKDHFFFRYSKPDYNFSSYFRGREFYKDKARKLFELQKELEKHGTTLIVAIPPSKSYYHFEHLPERNKIDRTSDSTNYDCLKKELLNSGVNWIDLNAYFLKKRHELSYPLFAKGGFHWSSLGSYEGMREIMNYASSIKNTEAPDIKWYAPKRYTHDVDVDIMESLNLMYPPDDELAMKHSHLILPNDTVNKPSALVVSDSFFDAPFWADFGRYFSDDFRYWYYFNVANDLDFNQHPIDKTNLVNETKGRDYIILINSILNLHDFGWRFIDEMHAAYCTNK